MDVIAEPLAELQLACPRRPLHPRPHVARRGAWCVAAQSVIPDLKPRTMPAAYGRRLGPPVKPPLLAQL